MPLPPSTSRARAAMFRALATLFILNIETVGASSCPASYVYREELAKGDLAHHRDELLLYELERGYGLAELIALFSIGESHLVAVGGLAETVPADTVARVGEDRERRAEALGLRQAVLLRDATILQLYMRLPGGALGAL